MSPQPVIDEFGDGDQSLSYVRRIPPSVVVSNADTGELELIPQKAFVFNPDLSIHQEEIIETLGSTVSDEYEIPDNGAVYVPTVELCSGGAHLKATPHTEEPILGPAHHSIFGGSLTPSKTDKAAMRDVLLAHLQWIARPVLPAD
ncbi:hypothetical protein [Microbacterium paraoxydans]|uniref:hypothetical protein n=1 Tax=Microbacterium paraoxydans TaxID=199592 RepID=UPI0030134657